MRPTFVPISLDKHWPVANALKVPPQADIPQKIKQRGQARKAEQFL